MEDGIFDAAVAERYDEDEAVMFTPEVLTPTVDFLAGLAGDGPALELAVGTGRVALPLLRRGIDVHGIELSTSMVAELRAKPDGDRVPVAIGDMATTRVPHTFTLVYLVFNTITNLLSQDEQVACFQNAAAHLEPGGFFVIEVFVPGLRRLPTGETHVPFDVSAEHLGIDEYDVANQRLVSHHVWTRGGRVTTHQTPHRYAWPAEYDLMARLAGMRLRERWADWKRTPFTSESTSHVSVYARDR